MTTTIDETFAALGDATRIDIVLRLGRGPASVSELGEPHDMSLRAVLKHVHVLEAAGIVRTTKVGRVRQCELRIAPFDAADRWLGDLRRRWERRLDRLEEYLDESRKGAHDG